MATNVDQKTDNHAQLNDRVHKILIQPQDGLKISEKAQITSTAGVELKLELATKSKPY